MDSSLLTVNTLQWKPGLFSSDASPLAVQCCQVTLGNIFLASVEKAYSSPNMSFLFYIDSTV